MISLKEEKEILANGEDALPLDTNMNKYKLVKYVYGNSIEEVLHIEKGGEIIYIDLQETVTNKLGFNTNYDRERDKVV